MFQKRVYAGDGPSVATAAFALHDELVSVGGDVGGEPPRFAFGQLGLDVFFGCRFKLDRLRDLVREQQVERESHRHVHLVIISGERVRARASRLRVLVRIGQWTGVSHGRRLQARPWSPKKIVKQNKL
jgi:hypothetical protein